MYYFIFGLIVLVASLIGAIAGIGGGVIIRPLIDATQYFSNANIPGVISSFCVLIGSLTTVGKNIISKNKIDNRKTAVFLGIGAAIGGVIGQILFKYLKEYFASIDQSNLLVITQSIVLITLLVLVIIYMKVLLPKDIKFHIKNYFVSVIIGLFLGIFSAFLGIGGGPINVAALILLFGMTMKQASINSLIIIIFSQITKISYMALTGVFNELATLEGVDATWWIFLLIFIPISIIGSLIGTYLNKKIPEKGLQWVYIGTMVVIIGINIYNIVVRCI